MILISKIEIAYFRSIYSATIRPCADVNVMIGGNDAGKSNLLKALNLFFNNETDLKTAYSFVDDITNFREEEAASAKGRATVWIKITFNNVFGWSSLPKTFTVKRTWNRYSPSPEQTISPQSFNGKQVLPQTIARFLNKISFHYIPAVKSRHIFSYYLGQLHDALLEDNRSGLSDSAQTLTTTINASIEEMSVEIRDKLGFESTIKVPQNFKNLFETLDFSTKFGTFDIPLQHRGDGIQARHIPFILNFIAHQSSKLHIWAYEEPENSLEMSKAFELAAQFESDFAKDNQIFLTTHSPAFYDLSGKRVSKWLAESTSYKQGSNKSTIIRHIDNNSEPDISLGIADLVKGRAKELYEEKELLDHKVKELEQSISTYQKPIVITEGKTDVKILESAWLKLRPNESMPFELCSCNVGSSEDNNDYAGVNMLAQCLNTTLPNTIHIRIGIFDRDTAGKKFFHEHLTHFDKKDSSGTRKHSNSKAFAILLPEITVIDDVSDYWDTKELAIEFLFKKQFLTSSLVRTSFYNKDGNKLSEQQAAALEQQPLLLGCFDKKYEIRNKTLFANNKVPQFSPEAFENFVPLFDTILSIIANN